jgi:hypothetical protein
VTTNCARDPYYKRKYVHMYLEGVFLPKNENGGSATSYQRSRSRSSYTCSHEARETVRKDCTGCALCSKRDNNTTGLFRYLLPKPFLRNDLSPENVSGPPMRGDELCIRP